jgi:hypothetical protein
VENYPDDYSNADLPSDSEIVITCSTLGEGGGGENSTPVTVESVTVVEKAIALMPLEQTSSTSADEAIAPTPSAPPLAEPEPGSVEEYLQIIKHLVQTGSAEDWTNMQQVIQDYAFGDAEKAQIQEKLRCWDGSTLAKLQEYGIFVP